MKIATRTAFGETLKNLGDSYQDIFVVDADLSGSTKTALFAQSFPERFFNAGIAEQDMVGIAAGLSITGKNVFSASFASFSTGRAYDQIRNTVAYSNLNVKIVGSHAGLLTGEDGATHQMLEDISLMRSLPNMLVLSPSDSVEAAAITKFLADYQGPAYLRLGRTNVNIIHDSSYQFELAKGEVLQEGQDICLISTGACVVEALFAAEQLKKEKINVQVVNIASIKPLDIELITSIANNFAYILTIEDHAPCGGLGSAVAEVLAGLKNSAQQIFCAVDSFGESGTPKDLYQKYKIDASGIVDKVKNLKI